MIPEQHEKYEQFERRFEAVLYCMKLAMRAIQEGGIYAETHLTSFKHNVACLTEFVADDDFLSHQNCPLGMCDLMKRAVEFLEKLNTRSK